MELTDVSLLFAWLLMGVWCFHCCTCVQYLYFTSTDGTTTQELPAGLYGGPIQLKANGSGQNLFKSGYYCTFFSDGEVYGNENKLYIQHLAYDPISKKALLRLMEPQKDYLTVLVAPMCRQLEACKPNVTKRSGLEFIFWKAAVKIQVAAITYYDNTIYYIVVTHKRKNSRHYEGSLELHELNGCKDQFPVSAATDYDISSCTRCIATLVTGEYRKFANFKPTDHIQVIKSTNGLRFLTQTQTFHYNDEEELEYLSMELLIIDEDGIVTQLHKQQISLAFKSMMIEHLGGLSYKDGLVCWSTINMIFCGDLDGSKLKNVFKLLPNGATLGICAGTMGEPFAANVTSGVAIVEAKKEVAVYFGCIVSPARGVGGAGLVRMFREDEKSRHVFVVSSDGDSIYAGSMFVTDECSSSSTFQQSLLVILISSAFGHIICAQHIH